MKKTIFAVFFALMVYASVASAEKVTLVWEPNPEPDVAGYKIYLVDHAKPSDKRVLLDAGKVTTTEVTFVVQGIETYDLRATAYDAKGNESAMSVPAYEVTSGKPVLFSDVTPPSAPSMVKVLERIAAALEKIAESIGSK